MPENKESIVSNEREINWDNPKKIIYDLNNLVWSSHSSEIISEWFEKELGDVKYEYEFNSNDWRAVINRYQPIPKKHSLGVKYEYRELNKDWNWMNHPKRYSNAFYVDEDWNAYKIWSRWKNKLSEADASKARSEFKNHQDIYHYFFSDRKTWLQHSIYQSWNRFFKVELTWSPKLKERWRKITEVDQNEWNRIVKLIKDFTNSKMQEQKQKNRNKVKDELKSKEEKDRKQENPDTLLWFLESSPE